MLGRSPRKRAISDNIVDVDLANANGGAQARAIAP
jgi:hypothetical protein